MSKTINCSHKFLNSFMNTELYHAEHCKWMSDQSCQKCLLDVKPSSDRIGPLAVLGPLENSVHSDKWTIPPNLHSQVCCCLLP